MTDHVIGEAVLNISFASEKQANEHQENLGRVLESNLLPIIREVFEELAPDQSEAQIDRLELDLGPVRPEELEGELPKRLKDKLRRALRDYIVVSQPAGVEPARRRRIESSAFDKVEYFLRFGHLTWSTPGGSTNTMADLLREVLRESPDRLARLLAESPELDTIAMRLWAQFPEHAVEDLVAALRQEHSALAVRLSDARARLDQRQAPLQKATAPDDSAVRGYELYDQLRRTLVEGEPLGAARLDEILDELLQKYPVHLLRLYREMQAGDGISSEIETVYGVDTLRRLVEAFLAAADLVSGNLEDFRHAIGRFAARSDNQRVYYARVLESLVRNDLIDLEALAAEPEYPAVPETIEEWTAPAGSALSALEELVRIAELPVRQVSAAKLAWLKAVLFDKDETRRIIESLAEPTLVRLLRLAGVADSNRLLRIADDLLERGYRDGMIGNPAEVKLLKWELLFRYAAAAKPFHEEFIHSLAQRIEIRIPPQRRASFLPTMDRETPKMSGGEGLQTSRPPQNRDIRTSDKDQQTAGAAQTWDVLIRTYELYDTLLRQLAEGSDSFGRSNDILRELTRVYPFHIRRLFSQLQEDPGLRAGVQFHRTAQELAALLDAFLTVSAIPEQDVLAVRQLRGQVTPGAPESRAHYVRVFTLLFRGERPLPSSLTAEPSQEETREELHDGLFLVLSGRASEQQTAAILAQLESLLAAHPALAAEWFSEVLEGSESREQTVSHLPERILVRVLGLVGSKALVSSISSFEIALDAFHVRHPAIPERELRAAMWIFAFRHALTERKVFSQEQAVAALDEFLSARFAPQPDEKKKEEEKKNEEELRIQAILADRRRPLPEQTLLQALLARLARPAAQQLLTTADTVAAAYYREADLRLQSDIARLKWQLIFSDALMEEPQLHVEDFESRFHALLTDRLASLTTDALQPTAPPVPAKLPASVDADWTFWIRAYELYDRLRQSLMDGRRGSVEDFRKVLDETLRLYPWQLLRLYRELQSGDGLSVHTIQSLDVEDLRRLAEAFLKVSETSPGDFDGLRAAIVRFTPPGTAAKPYYAGVLEQMVRGEAIDLEHLASDATRATIQSATDVRAIRLVINVVVGQILAALRILAREIDTKSVRQATDALTDEFLKGLLQQHRETPESIEIETAKLGESLSSGVAEGEIPARVLDALRERLVIRLLRHVREADYERLTQTATTSLRRWQGVAGELPRSLDRLEWEFILTYAISEHRDVAPPAFREAFEAFLEARLGPRPRPSDELLDELRRILIVGETIEGALKPRLEELADNQPEQLRKLSRELRGEPRFAENILRITDVADLKSLIDAIATPDEIVEHYTAVLAPLFRRESQPDEAEVAYAELRTILVFGEPLKGGIKVRLTKARRSRPALVRRLFRELQIEPRTPEVIRKIRSVPDLKSLIEAFSPFSAPTVPDSETAAGYAAVLGAMLRKESTPDSAEVAYDELRRMLVLGEPLKGEIKTRLAVIRRSRPELASRLFREMRVEPRTLEVIRGIRSVADLKNLIETFSPFSAPTVPDSETAAGYAAVLGAMLRKESTPDSAEVAYDELRRMLVLGEPLKGEIKTRLAIIRRSRPELASTLFRELRAEPRSVEFIRRIQSAADLNSLIEAFSAFSTPTLPVSTTAAAHVAVLERILREEAQPGSLFEELVRILILGDSLSGSLASRLEEFAQLHPEHVAILYRELQADARTAEKIRKITDATDLRALIDTFSTPEASTRRHAAVLERIVRSTASGMEAPGMPALLRSFDTYDELRRALILGETVEGSLKSRIEQLAESRPEKLRSLYREMKSDSRTAESIRKIRDVADLKSLLEALLESQGIVLAEGIEIRTAEDVVEQLLGKQAALAVPKRREVSSTEALKAFLLDGTEMLETPQLVRAAESMFWHEPARLRSWIEKALQSRSGAERLVRLLPDRLLVRALLAGTAPSHADLTLRYAEALALAAAKPEVGLHPRRARQLKWEFLLLHALGERRAFHEQEFRKAFAAFIASEPNVPEIETLDSFLALELDRERVVLLAETSKDKPLQPIELKRGIQLSNVGMVLAAPYLPRLFSQLNLMDGRNFRDYEASERAIHLLQFMVNESEETPEPELVLNKILCGVAPEMPVRQKIELTDREKIMAESLIAGMIQNWKKVGNTSIAGFRESFLQRDGTLMLKDDEWHLDVEPRAFDMLLDYIPWSYTPIRHSWMAQVVHVHWR